MRRTIAIIGIVALAVTGACAVAYFGFLVLGCFTGYRTSSITPQKCDLANMVLDLLWLRLPIPPAVSVPIITVVALTVAVLIVRQVRRRPGGG